MKVWPGSAAANPRRSASPRQRASRNDDIAARQKRYLFSMGIRTVCFVGAIVASLLGIHWLWPILIVAALLLPYVAVVMANAATTKGDGFALRRAAAQSAPSSAPGGHGSE